MTFKIYPTKQVHSEKFIIKHQNLYAPCKMHPRSSGQLEPLVIPLALICYFENISNYKKATIPRKRDGCN
jgi:hypothetical protein